MKTRKEVVIEIINHLVGGKSSCEIDESVNLRRDLGMDSLDVAELKMKLENEFLIIIPDEMDDKFNTVQDILNYLNKVLPEKI